MISKFFPKYKKSQVTLFIILAIMIVAGTVSFIVFKDLFIPGEIPHNLEPVYDTFLSCLNEDIKVGIDILESQGGYIKLPEFESGSDYMPFSSQLNFVGTSIPYWYYVSGNNIQKEQIPSKIEMEKQLESFVEEKIYDCSFEDYYKQGFEISFGEPKVNIKILKKGVEADINMNLAIKKGNDSVRVENHSILVNSNLGNLYESAKKIYDKEQEELFLEKYTLDVLRLYAPVDGVELTCSPLIWNANEVFDELENSIEANILALKTKGGDYSLKKKEDKYFVLDLDENARFITSKNFSHSFEVSPSEGSILIAEPVGNQPGLGALGFCYVPYHFVYSLKYPVLVQVYSNKFQEIFQFPVAVIIQGNQPREPLETNAIEFGIPDFCKYKNTLMKVKTYDMSSNSIDSQISYECLGTVCDIGETENGILTSAFPQCVNGYIIAKSEGFEETKYLSSTTSSKNVEIFLYKLYNLSIDLNLEGREYNGNAIIHFNSDKNSKTIVYPERKSVELSEGQYEIKVYIYRNSSLKLEEVTYEQCVDVPKSGLGSFFGLTEEKCFEMKVPEQIIPQSLAGGGTQNHYILDSDLKNSRNIKINVQSLPEPKTIEDLQNNYLLFEDKGLNILFR
jgi:hypothetical protein